MAGDFEAGGSPLYARLARAYADHPLLVEIAGDRRPQWEIPLRLFGGVHLLALAGEVEDPWSRFPEVLAEHRERLARFVAEQPVQTNEVQRSWGLLPAFLAVADERPLDLVELGPSAGINLVWDRYRYRYGGSAWGPADAELELRGEAHGGPPAVLLARTPQVRGRVGIDRAPIDATAEEGALLLQAFVWADQTERLERLRRAIVALRRDPPELVAGDYVRLLPDVLAARPADGLTVVYHSMSTGYLADDEKAALREAIAAAGRKGPLAWVSYEFDEEEEIGYESFALDVRVWPDGRPRRLARLDGHANRLRWVGE